MRLLIVEDDPSSPSSSPGACAPSASRSIWPADGLEGLQHLDAYDYDLLILDLMLPQLSGTELLRRVRARHPTLPVLVLTARDATEDKVEHFEAGADDYLTKPFDFAELLVRVQGAAAAHAGERTDVLRIARSRGQPADPAGAPRRSAHRADRRRNTRVLEYLLSSPGRVFSRTMILEHVWDQSFEGVTNIVDVYVRYLRRKIDDPFPVKLIQPCAAWAIAFASPSRRADGRARDESSLARLPAGGLVRAAAERDLRAGRRRHVLRARAVPALEPERLACVAARRRSSRSCSRRRAGRRRMRAIADADRHPRRSRIQQSLRARHARPARRWCIARAARPIAASIPPASRRSAAPGRRTRPGAPRRDAATAPILISATPIDDRLGALPGRARQLARSRSSGAGPAAEPARHPAAGAGRLCRRRRLSAGAAGAAAGRAHVADRRADQRAEPGRAAAGRRRPAMRCSELSLSLNHMLGAAARVGADLAPLSRRRLA